MRNHCSQSWFGLFVAVWAVGCSGESSEGVTVDAAPPPGDAALPDAARPDAFQPDATPPSPDADLVDARVTADAAPLDAEPPDQGPPPPDPVHRPAECGAPMSGAIGPAGGEIVAGVEAGALVDARLSVPAGALESELTLTLGCGEDLMRDGFVAAGPAMTVAAEASTVLAADVRVRWVFDAAALPARIEPRHLRLFWLPDRYDYVAEPPLIDPIISLVEGTVEVSTPGLGTFQIGYAADAGEPVERRFTYRAISGISMGGGATAYLGPHYQEHFDLIVPLGGPVDWPYLMHYFRDRLLAGFCRAGEGEGVGAWCGLPEPTEPYEHASSFLFWFFADGFHRSEHIDLLDDLAMAYGNPFIYNAESPYLPPRVTLDELLRSSGARCAAECRREDCPPAETFTIESGFYDDDYNPDGSLPVILFCDGETGGPRGHFDPDAEHGKPVSTLLAVDVNGNGRRDAYEPVIRNLSEPYADMGCDGVPSAEEPGYDPVSNPDPAGDDAHWYRNPRGSEGNWLYDGPAECAGDGGEPFDDFGLDGVPGTPQIADGGFDLGEGNATFDYNPNLERMYGRGAASLLRDLTPEQIDRLRFWTDAGLRDVFNFGIATQHLAGAIQAAGQNVHVYQGFRKILPKPDPTFFPDPRDRDPFGQRGQSVFVHYGNPDASDFDIEQGDGGHVGTAPQVLNRFMTMFDWVLNRWPEGDYEKVNPPFDREDKMEFFHAERYGKTYRYGVSLPPGYSRPANAERRYPVVLLLHGYGMGPEDLPVTGPLLATQMAGGAWQKAIVVFPEGFCGKASRFACNDGVDNDGDGHVDSANDQAMRVPCAADADCVGRYRCRESAAEGGHYCCPPEWTDCGPPDPNCGLAREGRGEGDVLPTLCSDGVDNDVDGKTDLEDEGCVGRADQNSEADCVKGSFYTRHVSRKDGLPGGPDFEAAMFDMLDHLDANYRTKRAATVVVPK